MKLCKDCKWCSKINIDHGPMCFRPEEDFSFYKGKFFIKLSRSISYERTDGQGHCGSEAKYFEPRFSLKKFISHIFTKHKIEK